MHANSRRHAVTGLVLDASDALLRIEKWALMGLMSWLTFLILVNVVTRYARIPLYWADEAAVYSVVWLTFVGASLMTRLRLDFAVTMLTDRLGERGVRVAKCIATFGTFFFGASMIAMCWLWMDPVGIAKAGFDAHVFSGESFNFLYTERTQTLEWPVWILQLILPIFSITFTLHALANLIEDLGWESRRTQSAIHVPNADVVN